MLQPLTCNMPGHVIMENCTTILPKSHPTACDYSSTDAHNHKACHAILGLSSTIINQWLQFCSCSQGGIFSRLPWNFVSTKLQNAARLYTLRRRHYYKKSARQYKIPPCDFVRTESQNAARAPISAHGTLHQEDADFHYEHGILRTTICREMRNRPKFV